MRKTYRQGDTLLIPVSKIPEGLVKTKSATLALGEVTGHHHTFSGGATCYAEKETDLALYVEVTEDDALLTHQEHDPIHVAPGLYKSAIQVEYVAGKVQNVAD